MITLSRPRTSIAAVDSAASATTMTAVFVWFWQPQLHRLSKGDLATTDLITVSPFACDDELSGRHRPSLTIGEETGVWQVLTPFTWAQWPKDNRGLLTGF